MTGRAYWAPYKMRFIVASIALTLFVLPLHATAVTNIYPSSFLNVYPDVTWTKAGSPYVIHGNPYVRHGIFAIEPGTVIKFTAGSVFAVHADVVTTIVGTSDEPIYFTSFKDDSVGGDTNDDGSASAPAPGDWAFVSLGGGSFNRSMTVRYVKVRYGGSEEMATIPISIRPSLYITYSWYNGSPWASYTLDHIEVAHSLGAGLYVEVGGRNSVRVSQSSFRDNGTYGVYRLYTPLPTGSFLSGRLDARDNWWGDATGPFHPTRNTGGLGNHIDDNTSVDGGAVDFISWLTTNPLPDAPPEPTYAECCSSVLFIPGFQANRLYEDVLGTEQQRWLPGLLQSSVEALRLSSNGTPQRALYTKSDAAIRSVDVPLVGFDIYRTFFDQLQLFKTSGTIRDYHIFPYDWRLNPEAVVTDGVMYDDGRHYLADELEQLARNSLTGKVTLVGHSNGGLVAKALMRELERRGEAMLVDKVVLVGSPQLGTPKALASILHGDYQEIPEGAGWLMLSKQNARALAEYMPGAFGLLPSAEYYARVADPVFDLTHAEGLRVESSVPSLIDSYSAAQKFMTGNGIRPKPVASDIETPNVLSQLLLAEAGTMHARLDAWVPPSGVDVIQIAGWGLDTPKSIIYSEKRSFLCPTLLTCYYSTTTRHTVGMTRDGDETVVGNSATALDAGDRFYINLPSSNSDNDLNQSHIDLTEVGAFQNLFDKIITKQALVILPQYVSVVAPVSSSDRRLRLRVFSPVSIGAIDSIDRHTGRAANPLPGSDYLYKEEKIPNSSYQEFGETKYLGLPNGKYNFEMNGYDTGTFTLAIDQVEGGNVVSSTIFEDIPVTSSTRVAFDVQSDITTLSPLALDKDGDGTTDYVIISNVVGVATLPKAPMTVTAEAKSITVGGGVPPLTSTLSGFVGGDTPILNDIVGTQVCTTAATSQSPAGMYPITCTAGTLASNYYKFENFIAGTLTINYKWSGFMQPIDDPVAQAGATPSIFKAGSTVPVKFKLKDANGNPIQATALPLWLAPVRGAALSATVDEPIYSDPATSGTSYRWDSTSQQYIYNWKTQKTDAGYWYRAYARLDDGKTYSVMVGLR